MKKIIVLSSLCILALFFIIGCNEKLEGPNVGITAKPMVKKSSINYTAETFSVSFPESTSLKKISEAYKNNFSEAIRGELLEYMKSEVTKLGEDINIFDNVLSQTGCKLSGEYVLPTYAERAKYEGQDVWILQVTYGLGEPNFAHFKCFALGMAYMDTLAYVGCK